MFLLNKHILRLLFFSLCSFAVEYGPYVLFCSLNVPLFVGCCFCQKYWIVLPVKIFLKFQNVLRTVGIKLFPSFLKGSISSSFTALIVAWEQWYLLKVFNCVALARLRAPWWQDPDPVFISRGEVKNVYSSFVINSD